MVSCVTTRVAIMMSVITYLSGVMISLNVFGGYRRLFIVVSYGFLGSRVSIRWPRGSLNHIFIIKSVSSTGLL